MARAIVRLQYPDDEEEDEELLMMQCGIIDATLKRSKQGVVKTLRESRALQQQKILLVVDQFEELFRFSMLEQEQGQGGRSDANAFVNLLLYAAFAGRLSGICGHYHAFRFPR